MSEIVRLTADPEDTLDRFHRFLAVEGIGVQDEEWPMWMAGGELITLGDLRNLVRLADRDDPLEEG